MATLTKQEILSITAEFPLILGCSARSELVGAPAVSPPSISLNGVETIIDDGIDHEFMRFLSSGDFLDVELPCDR